MQNRIAWLTLFAATVMVCQESAGFTPGNILMHNVPGGAQDLFEYTPSGAFVQQIPVTPRQGGADLTVDRAGRTHIFNSPTLITYDATLNSFTSQTFAGWSNVGNITYGGIASLGQYLFATDMATAGAGAPKGVVRFDLDGGPTLRFATDVEPFDLNVGLDGLLYTLSKGTASNGGGNRVDVFDPTSMTPVSSFSLPEEHRGIAVDFNGDIYTAQRDNVSRVNHFSPVGLLLDSINDPGVGGFADIDINRKGDLLIASHGGVVLVTTTALNSISSFNTRVSNGVNFATWIPVPVPEPCSELVLLIGGVLSAARFRRR